MKYIALILSVVWLPLFARELDVSYNKTLIPTVNSDVDLLKHRDTYRAPISVFGLEELNLILFNDMKQQNEDLKRVKYHLLNGDVEVARSLLFRLSYTQTKLKPVIYRYLAFLSFIENDFEKTYDYLALKDLDTIPHFAKICILKVLSEIVLNKTHELGDHWARCKVENTGNFNETNVIWLDTLVALKLKPREGMTKIPFKGFKVSVLEKDDLKVMLKLALYLNQETLVIQQLTELTYEHLQDPEVRELAGQIFFRSGALAKSYRFIEDMRSPNAENIKGNLYLLRKKYELAYAQFKLALEQKQNSQNAMERLLPLAWLLGDWEGGSKYAEQVISSRETIFNKMTIMAAFYMQKGDYEKSNQVLDVISKRSGRGTEIEVAQLAGFTALMQNKPELARKQGSYSCSQYDLISCWGLFQLTQWDAFPLTIRRDEKIPDRREWEKLAKEQFDKPLKEKIFVNQVDIEELDDKLIQLIPSS